jgi:hypothetical protein
MPKFEIRDPEAGFHTRTTTEHMCSAIVLGAKVEYELGQSLGKFFPSPSKTLIEQLFNGFGILSTFSARIDFGFAIGLFGSMTRNDLNQIKFVRNEFAHEISPLSFDVQKISEACNKLRIPIHFKNDETIHDLATPIGKYRRSCEIILRYLQAEGFRITKAPEKPIYLL